MRKKRLTFEASHLQGELPGLLILNNLTNPILPKVHSRLASQDRQPIGKDLADSSKAGENSKGDRDPGLSVGEPGWDNPGQPVNQVDTKS